MRSALPLLCIGITLSRLTKIAAFVCKDETGDVRHLECSGVVYGQKHQRSYGWRIFFRCEDDDPDGCLWPRLLSNGKRPAVDETPPK